MFPSAQKMRNQLFIVCCVCKCGCFFLYPCGQYVFESCIELQKLTTREPDDDMIEVAIASIEAVFDWKAYFKETFHYDVDEMHGGEVQDESQENESNEV